MTAPLPPTLTDRTALARFRARALRAPDLFLHQDARADVEERLADVNRTFTDAAVVTAFPQVWRESLVPALAGARMVADDPVLDLTPGAHDLVVHALALHWADDPLGQIIQCARALRPDGLFIATLFGGQTLHELRATLAQAEADVTGGLAPRIAPMAEIRDLGALLQRAGLALPVADGWTRQILYRDLADLVRDLRAMGEQNALAARHRAPLKRAVWQRAQQLYTETFGDDQGRLPVTVETLVLTGWAPAASQPRPLRPGSAAHRLADALGTKETPLDP